MNTVERSYETIDESDLRRLAELALQDLEDMFHRNAALARLYRDRLLALALCQGGAAHYLHGRRGVKDFDVWAFFAKHPMRQFPYRRRGTVDFGPSKFGRHPDDIGFLGRRVDVLGRSIRSEPIADPDMAIRSYLTEATTKSARFLAERPVVLIYPETHFGRVVWSPKT